MEQNPWTKCSEVHTEQQFNQKRKELESLVNNTIRDTYHINSKRAAKQWNEKSVERMDKRKQEFARYEFQN